MAQPTVRTAEHERRLVAAALVREAMAAPDRRTAHELDLVESRRRSTQWDDELERLLTEARADRSEVVEVPLPSSLSATAAGPAARRPRRSSPASWPGRCRASPRRPPGSAPGSTPGWRPASASSPCSTPTTCPGRGDLGIDDEDDLRELIARLRVRSVRRAGARTPSRPPFALVLAGQVVRGRIDAVYAEPDGGWLVVDWKTNRRQTADPLQLAIYRLAWAELLGVPLDRVAAGFHYVRIGETVAPDDLPDRQGARADPARSRPSGLDQLLMEM